VNVGVAGQFIVALLGVAIVGGMLSTTDIVCDAVAALLQPSFAVQVLVTE
jgi:hypothetical protein